jgi:hypothetical protein
MREATLEMTAYLTSTHFHPVNFFPAGRRDKNNDNNDNSTVKLVLDNPAFAGHSRQPKTLTD